MKSLYGCAALLHRFYTDVDKMAPKLSREESMEIISDVVYLAGAIVFFLLSGALIRGLGKL